MLDEIADYKPDTIVMLGDLHEADSASKWPSEYTWTLEDEFESANEFLTSVRSVAPQGAELIMLNGNHDDNLQALGRIPSKVRSLVRYEDHESEFKQGHWKQKAEYVFDKKRGVYRIGQVAFYHGWKSGKGADETQALVLTDPYSLAVSGHSHCPLPVTQATKGSVRLPYWYANAGTLRDMDDVPFMSRKDRSNWGQGCVRGEASLIKSPRLYKTWEAELRLRRMYGE